jgi:hypothetical protein
VTRIHADGVLDVRLGRDTGLQLKHVAEEIGTNDSALLDLLIDVTLAVIKAEREGRTS